MGSSPTLGAKCRLGFENRERTTSRLLATPHNTGLVQIVRVLFLLLCFSRRWRTHGYQTTNTDNERLTTDTETRRDNRIYYSEGVQRGQDKQVCTNGDRRRCSRMYPGVKNSAAACTTTQQHVQQRDTKAATCTTKSYTCSRMYNEETQAQPHVQHSHCAVSITQFVACFAISTLLSWCGSYNDCFALASRHLACTVHSRYVAHPILEKKCVTYRECVTYMYCIHTQEYITSGLQTGVSYLESATYHEQTSRFSAPSPRFSALSS